MKKVIAVAVALLLGGCSIPTEISKEQGIGLGLGGLMGSAIGYRFGGGAGKILFALVGAGLGAAAGWDFVNKLELTDQAKLRETALRAMHETPDGQLVTWNNQVTGTVGTLTPVRSYYANKGVYCRDFNANVAADAGIAKGRGRACRIDGGAWQFAGGA